MDCRLFTTSTVLSEVKKGKAGKRLEYLLASRLDVMEPAEDKVCDIMDWGEWLGDIISRTDAELLALAREVDAILLTDDYSMQNIASRLGIEFHPMLQRGIKREITWQFRCKGCKKIFGKKLDCCPVCGSELRRTPKSISTCQSGAGAADRS